MSLLSLPVVAYSVLTSIINKIFERVSVRDFGAVGDSVRLYDGNIAAGSTAFTTTYNYFTASSVGKTVSIAGAGPNVTTPVDWAGGGGNLVPTNLVTTIVAFISRSKVTVMTAATATVTNAVCEFGSDNTVAFTNAGAQQGGKSIYFPARKGRYLITGPVLIQNPIYFRGESLRATTIVLANSTQDGFVLATPDSCGLRDITFQCVGIPAGGGCVVVDGTRVAGVCTDIALINSDSHFKNLAFSNHWVGLQLVNAQVAIIDKIRFINGEKDDILCQGLIDGDVTAAHITRCNFGGSRGVALATSACGLRTTCGIRMEGGVCSVYYNHFFSGPGDDTSPGVLGHTYGMGVLLRAGPSHLPGFVSGDKFDTANFHFVGNVMDRAKTADIVFDAQPAATGTLQSSMVLITLADNQLGNGPYNNASNVWVRSNKFALFTSHGNTFNLGTTGYGHNWEAGASFTFYGETFIGELDGTTGLNTGIAVRVLAGVANVCDGGGHHPTNVGTMYACDSTLLFDPWMSKSPLHLYGMNPTGGLAGLQVLFHGSAALGAGPMTAWLASETSGIGVYMGMGGNYLGLAGGLNDFIFRSDVGGFHFGTGSAGSILDVLPGPGIINMKAAVSLLTGDLSIVGQAATSGTAPIVIDTAGKLQKGTIGGLTGVSGTANEVVVSAPVAGAVTVSLPPTITVTAGYQVGGTKVIGAQAAAVGLAIAIVDPAAVDLPTAINLANNAKAQWNDFVPKFNLLLAELGATSGHGLIGN